MSGTSVFSFTRRLYRSKKFKPIAPFLSTLITNVQGAGLRLVHTEFIMSEVLKQINKTPQKQLHEYEQELFDDSYLRETFYKQVNERGLKKYSNWEDRIKGSKGGVALHYGLVRELKPKIVVETGTATGSMTSFILAALYKNKLGKLISIDLPAVAGKNTMNIDVPENEVGYFIPEEYRKNWNYIQGDAKKLLPKVLNENPVDFFIHDSLHTRSHMSFEYSVARALMKENTIIMSDDILWNNSFYDFSLTHELTAFAPFSNPNLGVVVNTFGNEELNSLS